MKKSKLVAFYCIKLVAFYFIEAIWRLQCKSNCKLNIFLYLLEEMKNVFKFFLIISKFYNSWEFGKWERLI